MRETTVIVRCAVCNHQLRGYPAPNGLYAVNRHRANGRRCPGFRVFALAPLRTGVVAA